MNYYSYKYGEVLQMDGSTYAYLSRAMELAIAQDNMIKKEIISYPHMSKDNQNKVHDKMWRNATTEEMRESQSVTTDQLRISGVSVGNIADVIKGK
jgi:hypothetical protein